MNLLDKTFAQIDRDRKSQLLQRVKKVSGPLETECWIWKGPKSQGYGIFKPRTYTYTHRLAYELFVGPIARGLFINHICDVKLCCNPQHLYAGTPEQNREDYIRRQRARQVQDRLGWTDEQRYWFDINEAMRQEELRHE